MRSSSARKSCVASRPLSRMPPPLFRCLMKNSNMIDWRATTDAPQLTCTSRVVWSQIFKASKSHLIQPVLPRTMSWWKQGRWKWNWSTVLSALSRSHAFAGGQRSDAKHPDQCSDERSKRFYKVLTKHRSSINATKANLFALSNVCSEGPTLVWSGLLACIGQVILLLKKGNDKTLRIGQKVE